MAHHLIMSHPLASHVSLTKAMAHLSRHDHQLAPLITRYGLPTFIPHQNYYQSLVESIISQQLSVKAAATILRRFRELFPETHFPTPADILAKDSDAYRAVGLSRQKASYIKDLATKVSDATVRFDELSQRSNDEIVQELTKVKGVGVWTVHMFLIFCMGRLDVLPIGDLGIRNGMRALYAIDPTPEAMRATAIAHHWHPYESVASWYVWRSLENTPPLEAEGVELT